MIFYHFSSYYSFLFPFISSFGLSLSLGKVFLYLLKSYTQSKVREYTPTTHLQKNNTPTMGGLFILISIVLTSLYFSPLGLNHILLYLCLMIFAGIGFYDDWCKINKTRGISSSLKFGLQILGASLLLATWIYYQKPPLTVSLPNFFNNFSLYIGYGYILWGTFIIVGTSNAVNITDGLDGLATQSLIPNFILLAYLISSSILDTSLLPFCATIIGSLAGFLWYNRKPAQVFMGDVGSLPLGALLAFLFLMIKKEYLLPFSGIVFVLETVSVILQLYCIRTGKKRIFKLAPFHHHLELSGWNETQVVHILTLISLITCSLLFLIIHFL